MYTGKINAFEKQKFAAFQDQGWHEHGSEWAGQPTDTASALAALMGAGGKFAKLQAKPKASVTTKNRFAELAEPTSEPPESQCRHECCRHKQVRVGPRLPEVESDQDSEVCWMCPAESDDEEDDALVVKTRTRKTTGTANRGDVAAPLLRANTDPTTGNDRDVAALLVEANTDLEPPANTELRRGPGKNKAIGVQKSSNSLQTYGLMEFIKSPSRNILRRANKARRADAPQETMSLEIIKGVLQSKGDPVKPKVKLAPMSLRIKDPTPQKLAPLGSQPAERQHPTGPNGWEVMSAIVDSGATVSAIRPKVGREYKVEESESSKAGHMFQLADDSEIPCLGMKKMAVLTPEGHLRGMAPACADVGDTLQSVRQLLGAKHCVLFGLGENEDEHLIINKLTGEVSRLRDDGVNYLQDLLIVPPDEILNVQRAIDEGQSPFMRPGAK